MLRLEGRFAKVKGNSPSDVVITHQGFPIGDIRGGELYLDEPASLPMIRQIAQLALPEIPQGPNGLLLINNPDNTRYILDKNGSFLALSRITDPLFIVPSPIEQSQILRITSSLSEIPSPSQITRAFDLDERYPFWLLRITQESVDLSNYGTNPLELKLLQQYGLLIIRNCI